MGFGQQFMYTLAICLILELMGGVLALLFRNQVSKIQYTDELWVLVSLLGKQNHHQAVKIRLLVSFNELQVIVL